MFSKLFSTAAVVLATTQLVSAQTYTDCDPTKKTCPADPALDGTVTVDFTKGANKFFKEADGTKLTYDSNGAVFTINKETEAPTITSTEYLFFGKIDVEVQASTGQGVVTSFVLQSDDLDEIDWEWLGGDTTQVQTNYFGKGDTTTYDRGAYHTVASPQTQTHTYSIDWTKDYVRWSIDGTQVRELKYADAKGGTRFPQTPMQVKLGTWVAGRSDAAEGTVQWAGGKTDMSKAPFIANYKSVTIQNYNNGVSGSPKQYVWNDGSDGSYQSIKIESGDGNDTTSSSTASPSTTGSATGSSTATSSDGSKTTLSTVTSAGSSTASGSASATGSNSASATGASSTSGSGSSGSSSTASSTSAGASSSSTNAPVLAGAATMGFSSAALGACLLSAFFL